MWMEEEIKKNIKPESDQKEPTGFVTLHLSTDDGYTHLFDIILVAGFITGYPVKGTDSSYLDHIPSTFVLSSLTIYKDPIETCWTAEWLMCTLCGATGYKIAGQIYLAS